MIAIAAPIEADALRIRHEFLTVPGLHASPETCGHLLRVSPPHAERMLEALVQEGFLDRRIDGQYARRSIAVLTARSV